MKTKEFTAGVLTAWLCLVGPVGQAQVYYDVSRDYLSAANPGAVWSYGWKPSLAGPLTALTYHQTQPLTGDSGWEFWARAVGTPTSVYRTTGSVTLYSDGGAGVYPPGSVWFGPGVEPSEDRFGVIRFTVPERQGGRYRIGVAVRTRLELGASDADFHVVRNGIELFGTNIVPVSKAAYTNEVTLSEGDTIDFLCGRGDDGREYGGGLKIAARLWKLGGVTIRVSEVELCWETESNQWYQVQYRSALTTNEWVPLHPGFLPGTGSTFCTNDPVTLGASRRFYQVTATTNAPPTP